MLTLRLWTAGAAACLLSSAAWGQANAGGDSQFLNTAADFLMKQAHVGDLAQNKAVRPEVKQFGQQLAQDAKAGYGQLQNIARDMRLALPAGIQTGDDPSITRLGGSSGEDFERTFLQHVSTVTQAGIDQFQRHAGQGGNAALKDFAGNFARKLQEHLQKAQALSSGGQQPAPAAPTPPAESQTAAPPSGSADRAAPQSAQPAAAPAAQGAQGPSSEVVYATVTLFQPGQRLELKERGRAGHHVYDLIGANANIAAGIGPGSKVRVTEAIDENGRQTLTVESYSF